MFKQKNLLLRTDNPNAEVTTKQTDEIAIMTDLEAGTNGILRSCTYQDIADCRIDQANHREIYIDDNLIGKVFVDRFGNSLTQSDWRFRIRDSRTVKALCSEWSFPRHQSAEPTNISDLDILEIFKLTLDLGVKYSFSIVRPKYGEVVGDYLCFWPSHLPAYGASSMTLLGRSLGLEEVKREFSDDRKFDPTAVWVGMPFLSDYAFNGKHTILGGTGRNRLVVANGGLYSGGVKKPITFQVHDRRLPNRGLICAHYAMARLLDGSVMATGQTTAAGKSEISTSFVDNLIWKLPKGQNLQMDISASSPFSNPEVETIGDRRGIISDDITAFQPPQLHDKCLGWGAEIESATFYRDDLCEIHEDGSLNDPFAQACRDGKANGAVDYYNYGWNEENSTVKLEEHITLREGEKCTNPRRTYSPTLLPNYVDSGPTNPQAIDHLVISIPAPKLEDGYGWYFPSFVRLTAEEFLAHSLHGARANKDNPAIGPQGLGDWAFEGYGGKANFSLDTQSKQFARDLFFWQALKPTGSYWLTFNSFSIGGEQKFKYSGTYMLRFLLENYGEDMINCPGVKLPGSFTGEVPDLRKFVRNADQLDQRLWNPDALDQEGLHNSILALDQICYAGMNTVLGQFGHSPDSEARLRSLMATCIKRRFKR